MGSENYNTKKKKEKIKKSLTEVILTKKY